MKQTKVKFTALNIPKDLYFTCSELEQANAEQQERKALEQLEEIILNKNFIALQFDHINGNGKISTEILHHSPRNEGALFQLSYIYDDIPTMHENYIYIDPTRASRETSKTKLLKHFINKFYHHNDAIFTVLTA